MERRNIAIIGGGYTGLTAGYRLSQKGHNVTIYEKSPELGGLAGDFTIEGESLEKVYHHIFKTDTEIIALVKELGIEDKLEWRDSSVAIYHGGKIHPFNGAADLLKFKPLGFINRVRTGLVVLYLQKQKNWKGFENISAYNWMKKWSGKQASEVIWEPLLKGKFSEDYDKVSMAWLWARLHIRANSRESLEKEKLGYFKGGFVQIVNSLVEKLKQNNVEIVLNADVSHIQDIGGKVSLQVNGEKKLFDKVIATVPSHIFTKLVAPKTLPQSYIDKLNSIKYLGAVCMVFTSAQNLSKYYWHNVNDLASPFLVFINHTKLIPHSRYGGQNLYYIGSYIPHGHKYFEMAEDEIHDLWFNHVKRMFPEFDPSKVKDKYLFRFKYAQHIVDQMYKDKIPETQTPIPNVYLSNFSQIYPEDRGTNFAVREGNRIAELVGGK